MPKNVVTEELDLSAAWDTESEAELFIKKLAALGMSGSELRFCGFDARYIGSPRKTFFCCDEEDLHSGDGGEQQNALKFALRCARPVVAVYDATKLRHVVGCEYALADSAAIKAYIHLKR